MTPHLEGRCANTIKRKKIKVSRWRLITYELLLRDTLTVKG